jgi:hypothetical protein
MRGENNKEHYIEIKQIDDATIELIKYMMSILKEFKHIIGQIPATITIYNRATIKDLTDAKYCYKHLFQNSRTKLKNDLKLAHLQAANIQPLNLKNS